MTKNYPANTVFILLVLVTALYACKKDPGGAFDPTQTYVLSEILTDGKLKSTYEYNDQHQLIKSVRKVQERRDLIATSETTFFYNNDGRLIRDAQTQTSERVNHYSTEYEYNSEGRLVVARHYNEDNNHTYMNRSEYSYSGNTVTEKMIFDTIIGTVIISTFNDEGNMVKRVTDFKIFDNGDKTEEWFGYDNKKNVAGPAAGSISSKNNPKKRVVRQDFSPTATYTYFYTYNTANYVTRLFSHSSLGDYATVSKYEYIPVN